MFLMICLKKGLRFIFDKRYRFVILANKGVYDNMQDEALLNRKYEAIFGKRLNLDNPQTFNEKLQWLKLYDRNPEYTIMVDKYKVRDYIKEQHPGLDVEILTMKTTGDKILDRTLDKVGGKGLFVKELDKALLEGRTMLSVHSLKDMPMEVPEDLPLLAFSRREDPRDVLVLPEGAASLDPLKPLGCSSLRRTLQLQTIYPDMKVKSIRGNLQ